MKLNEQCSQIHDDKGNTAMIPRGVLLDIGDRCNNKRNVATIPRA